MPLDLDEHTPQVEDPNADEVSYNIDTATWGEEDSWFDWNQSPWTYPYAASNYSSWYQAFQAADFKSPYYYKSAFSRVSDSTNEAYRVQWRGLFTKDYYFGSPPPASVADLPIKSDKAITTKQWPTPWGFGIDSPMSNIYTVLPGYSSSGYAPGNVFPEVDTYYFYTNFANKFGKNLYKFSASDDWGMEVDTSKTGRPMPFVPLFMNSVSPSDTLQYARKDFKGTSSISSIYMTYPNYVPLSFNYQKIVVLPKVYCAKYNNERDYGLDFAGPFTLAEYFDGVNWDPDTQTGTAPKKDTYPMITAVRIDQVYFGTTDGTSQNRRTYLSGGTFNAFLPDTLTLGGPPSARILKNGTYNVYSSKWGADDNADNWHPATGYVIDGGLISGMGQNYNNVKTFTISLNTNLTDLRKSYINETQSTNASLPLFHQNGDYEIHCVQRHTNNGDTPQNTMGMCALWKNPTKEKVMRDVAYLGFWFADDYDTAERGFTGEDCNSSKMHIPLFDEDGLTTGKWLSGTDAAKADNAKWQDPFKSNPYDPDKTPPSPGPTPGPTPDPSANPILPVGLDWTLAGKGTGIWALTPIEIDEVWQDVFGSDIKLSKFGNNPMNAILSLKWTPFDWTQTGATDEDPIVLGDEIVNPFHQYPIINSAARAEKHGWGSCKFDFDKNFYNSRNMQARLFLPFYGYYELPMAQLLSSTLRIDFFYNVPDELGVYIITYDDVIYDYCECNCDIDIPITGSNAAAIRESKRSEALAIATQVASTALSSIAFIGTGGLSGVSEFASMAADAGGVIGGLQSLPYLYEAAPREAIRQVAGLTTGATLAGSTGANVLNTIRNARIERAALKTNLPYHGSALQTTFLHMSMKPYIQIFKNAIMEGFETVNDGTLKEKLGGTSEAQYKLKVGHACNVFATIDQMPQNSLLQATGMADMSVAGMEMAEVQELNSILQTGFYYTNWWASS